MTDILTADDAVVVQAATRPAPQPRWRPYEPQKFATFKAALFGTSGIVQITYYAG